MNSTLAYVISQQVNRLFLGPAYWRWLLLLILIIALSLILINRFMGSIWEASEQLDAQYSEINAQLGRYQLERDKINQAYKTFKTSLAQQISLENQFSKASSERLETILIQNAIDHGLHPNQIQVSSQLADDQGEYFRVVFKLKGTRQGLESFLEKLTLSEYFLVWENLLFDVTAFERLSLTISIKQYLKINHE